VLKSKKYFITATGTSAGKTYLLTKICEILTKKSVKVSAIKPVASGYNGDGNDDTALIIKSLGEKSSAKIINEITPWRLEKPVSPHIAGRINFDEVKDFCQKKIKKTDCDFLFIEGAGGVMTPISNDKTFLDLISELQIPILLVSANYLGSISHTLCSIEAIKTKNLVVEKIIINNHFSDNNIRETVETIENFSKIETILINDFLHKCQTII
jgi:dethiobiotin synthetase